MGYSIDYKNISEHSLIDMAQKGDKRASTRLLYLHAALIISCAKKWHISGYMTDDLIQECNLVAIKAINKFDLSTTHRLSTVITQYCHNHCSNLLSKSKTQKSGVNSITISISDVDETMVSSDDPETIAVDNMVAGELKEQILSSEKDERNRAILKMLAEGNSVKETAKAFGVSVMTVNRCRTKAKENFNE